MEFRIRVIRHDDEQLFEESATKRRFDFLPGMFGLQGGHLTVYRKHILVAQAFICGNGDADIGTYFCGLRGLFGEGNLLSRAAAGLASSDFQVDDLVVINTAGAQLLTNDFTASDFVGAIELAYRAASALKTVQPLLLGERQFSKLGGNISDETEFGERMRKEMETMTVPNVLRFPQRLIDRRGERAN